MQARATTWWRAVGLGLVFMLAGLAGGCRDSHFSGEPSEGHGLLVIDNWTGHRLRVYLDGERSENVSSGKHRYYELEPGLVRLALDAHHSDRGWAGDIDILSGRRTVVEVRSSGDYRSFEVRLYFD
ncbi:MAG: hypothetical protein GX803_02490 [Lentisphaerae bacterium]|jgi:hypothetical protein|nr:hypothetical protein [Lentisphaerota bacterium]